MAVNRVYITLPDLRQIKLDGDNFTWPTEEDTFSFHKRSGPETQKYRVKSTHISYELDGDDEVCGADVFMQVEEINEGSTGNV